MTDNKIGPNTIRPVAEPRTSDKPQRKEPVSGQDFSNTLKQVLNEINRQPTAAPAGSVKAIQDAAAAEQERFESVMRAKQQLSQAYLDLKNKPTQDKS